MKKIILIYFIVSVTILFAGCKSGSLVVDQTNTQADSKLSNVVEDKTNKSVEVKLNKGLNYKVNIKEYIAHNNKNKPYKVKYTQISGLGNKGLENKINLTLKSSITEWINKDCEWMQESQIYIKSMSSKYLSICYIIEFKDDKGADYMSTYIRIGVTVDMQSGERVYLEDLIKDNAALKQKLENYYYNNEFSPPIDTEEADKILHYLSISETKYFEEIYKDDPLVYDFMLTYMRVKPSFYLTDNRIVITRDENEIDDVYIDFKQ